MNADTHDGGDSVKKKEKYGYDLAYHRRAQRAFLESTIISFRVISLFSYLLSRQGAKDFAFPSISIIAARFNIGKSTVIRWIKETEATLGNEIFQVKQGKPHKGSMGKTRNHYHCLDFGYWPLAIVERLERAKPKRKPTKSKYVESIGPVVTPCKSAPVVSYQDHSVETMESVFTLEDSETQYYPYDSNPQNRICASCGQLAKDGFGYRDIWVCDVDCQQDYYERFMDVPDF